ncbi:MAG: hypothetical protein ACRES9_06830 [Gammaproteobacteria bacterium]
MNTRRLFGIFALVVAVSTLSACSGIPLSTMWHFRNFGPKNLVQTDPAQVHTALRSWKDLDLNGGAPLMHVTLQFKGEQAQDFEMPMTRITGAAAAAEKLPNPGSGREWYIFKLSPAGVSAFRKMQQAIKKNMNASGKLKKRVTLTIKFDTDQMHPSIAAKKREQKTKKIPVQIRLELSRKEGYYTLYSGKIPLKNKKSTSASG